jgi:hypothetical protein
MSLINQNYITNKNKFHEIENELYLFRKMETLREQLNAYFSGIFGLIFYRFLH